MRQVLRGKHTSPTLCGFTAFVRVSGIIRGIPDEPEGSERVSNAEIRVKRNDYFRYGGCRIYRSQSCDEAFEGRGSGKDHRYG